MKKVLVITDSLGLPRPTPEIVNYSDTWVNKLSSCCDLWQYSSGGATIKDLYSQVEYHKMYKPDIVIIQSGIVDCAPRALSKFENELINKFSLTKKLGKHFLTTKRLNNFRKKRNCYYTSSIDFEKYVHKYKEIFGDGLFWLGIVPARDEYEAKIPGIKKQIDIYNDILKRQLNNNYISISSLNKDDIMSDFIHLSTSGHNAIFEKIKLLLDEKSINNRG